MRPFFPDFKDFLIILNQEGGRYMVVRGWAVASHGWPGMTKDIDRW